MRPTQSDAELVKRRRAEGHSTVGRKVGFANEAPCGAR